MTKLYGKSDIYNFKILIEEDLHIKAYDFLAVEHFEYGQVLCQVLNIVRDKEKLIGDCFVIGFKKDGVLNSIKIPFPNDSKIEIANDKFISKVIGMKISSKDFIGVLEGHNELKINLDLKNVITKHLAILAKSGAGKSYSVGVILEEIAKKNVPILILDPHGEYSSLKFENDNSKDIERLKLFNLKPRGFKNRIKEFNLEKGSKNKISLDIDKVSKNDFIEMIPQKLSPGQSNMMYNILSNTNKINFDEIIFNVSQEENNSKWGLISMMEQMKKLDLFNENYTKLNEIIKPKQISIINLKGVDSSIYEILVSQLLKQLFMARKKEETPPFFLVLEEAHNFIPEKNLGEMKTSKICRTIAAEGRKFGLGLCLITQRPAKVDKNVLSQCSTQLILKITNPGDLKAVVGSCEGLTKNSEAEIQKLNIGSSLLCGVVDIPLKINIRPRITKHGETVNIVLDYENDEKLKTKKPETKIESQEKENTEFLEIINSNLDLEKDRIVKPAILIKLKNNQNEISNILIDKTQNILIKEFDTKELKIENEILNLKDKELKFLNEILKLNDIFNPTQLLVKSNYQFLEIQKLTKILQDKNLIKKEKENSFVFTNALFLKKINQLNSNFKTNFVEVKVKKEVKELISTNQIQKFFENFFKIENIKEVNILE
jgi:hypothetical protein